MRKKDQKFISYWENIVRKGRLQYAVIHGIIFGSLLFTISFIFSHFDSNISNLFIGDQFFYTLMIYILGGVLYEGVFSWYFNTKKYNNLIRNS